VQDSICLELSVKDCIVAITNQSISRLPVQTYLAPQACDYIAELHTPLLFASEKFLTPQQHVIGHEGKLEGNKIVTV